MVVLPIYIGKRFLLYTLMFIYLELPAKSGLSYFENVNILLQYKALVTVSTFKECH